MSDRHAEGIEKAARKIFEYDAPSHAPEEWEPLNEWAKVDYRHTALAAITAYQKYALPELTSAEELDALPVGAILHDREGAIWETGHEDGIDYLCRVGHEEGYGSSEVPLPARVIWWGDHA